MTDIDKLIVDLEELEAQTSSLPWNRRKVSKGEVTSAEIDLVIAMRNALPELLQELRRLEHVERLAEQRYEYIHSLGTETEEGYDLAKYLNALLAESAQEIERRGKCAEKAEAERDWLAKHRAELERELWDDFVDKPTEQFSADYWLKYAEREAAKESEGA